MTDDVTPVRQQYLDIKRQYPDTLLLFRLGDFYETFDQDAEITSRELDIVLTSRPIGKGLRAPLAGIPYHAIENYLARLIDKGYHVAICEQIGDQPTKGIFPRKVVRVVTPGTIIEPGLLRGDSNNYLAAVVVEENRAGIAYVDITTGEFAATEIETLTGVNLTFTERGFLSVRAELTRLNPAEIIFPDNDALPADTPGHLTSWPAWHFEIGKCREILLTHFKVSTLAGFGLQGLPLATRAAGGIIQYLSQTDEAALHLLTGLRVYSLNEFMTLDAATRRNLELTQTLQGELKGSLLGQLDQTVTPMGKRRIQQWVSQPLLDVDRIHTRQAGIDFFVKHSMLRTEMRAALKPLSDLERLVGRIQTGHALPRDLVAIRQTLRQIPDIQKVLLAKVETSTGESTDAKLFLPVLSECKEELVFVTSAIAEDPPATLQNTGIIRDGFSSELDGVIEASRHAREWINNLELTERQRTGIKTLKVGYNKVFGYYIEISKGQAANAPSGYIRKQTLVNAERFITPEMKEYETVVLNAEEHIHEIEIRIFREICLTLSKTAQNLLDAANALSELDVLSALAEVAALNGYNKPEITEDSTIDIIGGRHPVVEQLLQGERYVPNDISFEQGELIRIITGPNMSGKSTYLRQTALIVLMAQMGSFVPADHAIIGLTDRIFTRIGAQDEIHSGQSTFMVEMIEVANILHHATPRSLLILDEIGRGTSTYDGVSIAWAVVEYIHNHPQLRSKTLFATHYHELTQLADLLPGIRNYNVAVSESGGNVVFLHKIIPGGADRSYGIHVAQLAGLPNSVVQRATNIMEELEKTSGHAVRLNPQTAQQVALFPETSPLLDELKNLDINTLSPIEALNKLFEWQKHFIKSQTK
jgi:DNA mismatch repair protein MutS